jgi:hypothetical protein
MQYDFRSVYASILKEWFCVPDSTLSNVLLNNFQDLPIIKSSASCTSSAIDNLNADAGKNIITNYPNPFQASTTIQFESLGGHTLIQVFDVQGRLMKTIVDEVTSVGKHKVTFENEGYGAGVFYARLQNGALQQVRTMLIVN